MIAANADMSISAVDSDCKLRNMTKIVQGKAHIRWPSPCRETYMHVIVMMSSEQLVLFIHMSSKLVLQICLEEQVGQSTGCLSQLQLAEVI